MWHHLAAATAHSKGSCFSVALNKLEQNSHIVENPKGLAKIQIFIFNFLLFLLFKKIKLKSVTNINYTNMGGYTNYEVEFDTSIDWDDDDVRRCLITFIVQYLYLRDMDKPRVMLCVYSHNPIEVILTALKSLYPAGMRYRMYDSDAWIAFT